MIVGREDRELAGPVGLGVEGQEALGEVGGWVARIGCDGGGLSRPVVRWRAGIGCGQSGVQCSCAAERASGGSVGCFGVTCDWVLFFVVGFGKLIVTYGKVFKVMLPLPDKLSHIFHDIGDVTCWNGCVAGCSHYVRWCLAEVMKMVEDIVELMLEAVYKPQE